MNAATTLEKEVSFSEKPTGIQNLSRKSGLSPGATIDLDFHALGFCVRCEGAWNNSALTQFRHFLDLRGLAPTNAELDASLERARGTYRQGNNHLFLCHAQPCCNGIDFDTSNSALADAGRKAGVAISKTGCQGQCKHKPVASLRVGGRNQLLVHMATVEDWQATLSFVKTAARANSLLINAGSAERLLYDPVHDHGKPDPRLEPLRFLVGHFRGEGRFAMSDYSFYKEVIGTVEAGGHFIVLRMDATYPLADGRKDVHRALVVVGPKFSSGISGSAFTDGGGTHEYEVKQHKQDLRFADASPDHATRWKSARKILKPTHYGFEERLEVNAGDGFVEYYTITMQRVDAL